jgi:hypothetical protein
MLHAPQRGTEAYRWWQQGATDEAKTRDEGRTKAGRDVRDLVDALAVHHHELDEIGMVTWAFYICAAGLPLWQRLWIAWRGPHSKLARKRGS